MPSVQLLPGLRYQVKKDTFGNVDHFEIKKRLFADNIEVQNLKTGITHTILEKEIVDKLYADSLQFEVIGKNTKAPDPGKLRTEFKWQDISRLKPKRQVVALGRYYTVTEFIKLSTTMAEDEAHPIAVEKGLARLKERLTEMIEGLKPEAGEIDQKEIALLLLKLEEVFPRRALSTVREWKTNYISGGRDIRSLVEDYDECGAPGKTRRSNLLDDLIRRAFDCVYMKKERGSIKEVHEELVELIKKENEYRISSEMLKTPCLRSLYDWIERQDDKKILKARYGKRMARNAFRSTGAGVKTTRPFERLEVDDTLLPIFLIDDDDLMPIGKPLYTFGIDHYSTYPAGHNLSFHSPSEATVMECVRHAIEPKTYVASMYPSIKREWNSFGVWDELGVDLGKGYQAKAIEFACRQLGIDLADCPVRTPHYKGRVERFFRRINDELLRGLPGVAFDDIFDKKDYDPQKNAVLTLKSFNDILHTWEIEIYPQDWHNGINGVPQQLWDKGLIDNPRRYPPSATEMRVLMSHREHRDLHHYGFELWHIKYNDIENVELALLRHLAEKQKSDKEKTFMIKVDLWDLSRIWIHDHFNNRYICIPAVDQEYTKNLSYYKHKFVLKELDRQKKEKVDQEALRDARRRLRAKVKKEFNATRRMRTRKKLACILGKSDPLYRNEEDIDYDEIIEGPVQETCTSVAFEGASDFAAGQRQHLQCSPGEHNTIIHEENKIDKHEDATDSGRQDTFATTRKGITYSRAGRSQV